MMTINWKNASNHVQPQPATAVRDTAGFSSGPHNNHLSPDIFKQKYDKMKQAEVEAMHLKNFTALCFEPDDKVVIRRDRGDFVDSWETSAASLPDAMRCELSNLCQARYWISQYPSKLVDDGPRKKKTIATGTRILTWQSGERFCDDHVARLHNRCLRPPTVTVGQEYSWTSIWRLDCLLSPEEYAKLKTRMERVLNGSALNHPAASSLDPPIELEGAQMAAKLIQPGRLLVYSPANLGI